MSLTEPYKIAPEECKTAREFPMYNSYIILTFVLCNTYFLHRFRNIYYRHSTC